MSEKNGFDAIKFLLFCTVECLSALRGVSVRVEEGQILEVKIDSIDSDAHKIALRPVVADVAPAEKPAEPEAEKEDDPMEWIRANKVKNANVGNNPFAGLNF